MHLRLAVFVTLLLAGLSACGDDTSPAADAGTLADAGGDSGTRPDDAGPRDDAGTSVDAGDDDASAAADASTDADASTTADAGFDAGLVHGCVPHPEATAAPGEDLGGHTYTTWAGPMFFGVYCASCHSSTLVTAVERNYAPLGLDWNVPAAVHANLVLIRYDVGVSAYMPPVEPRPSCAERLELLRWIDSGAPL